MLEVSLETKGFSKWQTWRNTADVRAQKWHNTDSELRWVN